MRVGSVPYDVVILVCTNRREAGANAGGNESARPSCGGRDSGAIHAELKRRVKDLDLPIRVRVSQSGCLGICEEGPNVFVFPPGRAYFGVTIGFIDRIIDDLVAHSA
jgi:(2Fe-2S) ferredoxin